MALRVIGAGLPRTGTASLRAALERLIGGRCYHMLELFEHPEHLSFWQDAAHGDVDVDWRTFFEGYDAAVDWPASQYWRELMDLYPDAPVLLSVRDSADTWWRSADATVFGNARRAREAGGEIPPRMRAFIETLRMAMERLSPTWYERDGAVEAYERHNADVRATVPPERLVEWRPGDGWEPLARMLDVPVPDDGRRLPRSA